MPKEKTPRKLKVGSTFEVEINCQITGGIITVYVPIKDEKDTDFLLKWKANNWYKNLTEQEKQDIANELNRQSGITA
jgi:hypothetical protein